MLPVIKDPVEEEVIKDKAEEALRIAKELEEKMKPAPVEEEPEIDPATLINSPDFKAKAKEATGMTDAQVDFVIRTASVAAAAGNEKAALAEVKIRHPDFQKFEASITAELKSYPADKRGNAAIIEKLYYVEKGKEAEKNPGRITVPSRQPIRGSGPTGQGLDNGSHEKTGGVESLDDEERFVARKMGLTAAQYAKSKTTRLVNDLIE
jgi:hypothetical protein